jgi:hypothetical protein
MLAIASVKPVQSALPPPVEGCVVAAPPEPAAIVVGVPEAAGFEEELLPQATRAPESTATATNRGRCRIAEWYDATRAEAMYTWFSVRQDFRVERPSMSRPSNRSAGDMEASVRTFTSVAGPAVARLTLFGLVQLDIDTAW